MRRWWIALLTVCLLLTGTSAFAQTAAVDTATFESYGAYAETNLFVREAASYESEASGVLPPYALCRVVGTERGFAQIEFETLRGYVALASLQPLRKDRALERPLSVYVLNPCQVFAAPLAGEGMEQILSRLTILQTEAENGAYYAVQLDGQKVYVPKSAVIPFPYERKSVEFAQTTTEAHIYMAPDTMFYSEVTVEKDHLLAVVGRAGGYLKLDNEQGYVRTRDAETIYFREITPITGFWDEDRQLMPSQRSTAQPLDVTLYARTVVEVGFRSRNFYLLKYQDTWGYVPIEGFAKVSADSLVQNRIAARLMCDAELALSDGTQKNGKQQALSAATPLWALAWQEDEALVSLLDGTTGYIRRDALQELAADEAIEVRSVYTAQDKTAYLFPQHDEQALSVYIPQDTLLKQVATNDGKFCVEYDGQRYYMTSDGVYTDDNAETLPGHTQRYYLLLEKLDHKLTVYYADENGNRTDRVARIIITAVGKPSTPTPSGIFKLGSKQRWHRWSSGSRSPFAIQYTTDKYIHGPIYWRADESSLKRQSLEDIGHDRTSGCLRMAYEDAMWLYFHCASEETTLEIVKREAK